MLRSAWYVVATAWGVFGGWLDCTQAVPAERVSGLWRHARASSLPTPGVLLEQQLSVLTCNELTKVLVS